MDTRTKNVSLGFMGEGWQDCYVEMRYVKWADSKVMMDADKAKDWIEGVITRIERVYVSGKVLDDGQPVDMQKDDIKEFDIEALKVLNNAALGFVDPKE